MCFDDSKFNLEQYRGKNCNSVIKHIFSVHWGPHLIPAVSQIKIFMLLKCYKSVNWSDVKGCF